MPVILWTAVSSGKSFCVRAYSPSTRGKVPYMRGCGLPCFGPVPSDSPIESEPIMMAGWRSTLATFSRFCENERSEEHTSELQSHSDLVCRLLLEKKKNDAGMHRPSYSEVA